MKISFSSYISLFVATLILSSVLTAIMRKIAIEYQVVDRPSEPHKTHTKPVPYLGGVAILVSTTLISYLSVLISDTKNSYFQMASQLLIPSIIVGIVGLIDDIKKLSPWPRFVAQNFAAIISTFILLITNTLGTPTGSLFLDILLSILWIVGLTNAINFFDNLDGGASGTVAISSFFLFIISLAQGQLLLSAMSIVLLGATLGFLVWNRPPARIYMGDAGALFLGMMLASLTIRLDANPIDLKSRFAVPFFLVAVPILDTSVAVLSRIFSGKSPFQGGRDHLSHRLMLRGMSKKQAVVSLWLISLFFATLSLVLSISPFQLEGKITLSGFLIWSLLLLHFLSHREKK